MAGTDADTLDSFVGRLYDEGVAAGRREGERLVQEAEADAEAIRQRARAEAEAVLAEARERADRELARGRAELGLFARDEILELIASLTAGLQAILERAVVKELRDPAFLRELLREMVAAYARNGVEGGQPVEIRVAPEMVERLTAGSLGGLGEALEQPDAAVDVQGTLRGAGFEYRVAGGAIEVSAEAVVEKLMELVSPRLREVVRDAAVVSAAQEGADEGEGSTPPAGQAASPRSD